MDESEEIANNLVFRGGTAFDFTPAIEAIDMTKALPSLDFTSATEGLLTSVDMTKALPSLDFTSAIEGLLTSVDMTKALPSLDFTSAIEGLLTSVDMTKALSSLDFGSSRFTASYQTAVDSLLEQLDVGDAVDRASFPLPTSDDTAFLLFSQSAPELAAAIDDAAEAAGLPFWQRSAVRNGLAWFVAAIIVTVYIASPVLPPYVQIVAGLFGATGLNAPGAFKRIRGGQSEPPTL